MWKTTICCRTRQYQTFWHSHLFTVLSFGMWVQKNKTLLGGWASYSCIQIVPLTTGGVMVKRHQERWKAQPQMDETDVGRLLHCGSSGTASPPARRTVSNRVITLPILTLVSWDEHLDFLQKIPEGHINHQYCLSVRSSSAACLCEEHNHRQRLGFVFSC